MKQASNSTLDGWLVQPPWYEMAQDRALWRSVVRHLVPPAETTNNDPHTQAPANQPPS